MIILRSKDSSLRDIQEKEFTLKRRYQRFIGRARKKLVNGLESAILNVEERSSKSQKAMEEVPAVINKNASDFIKKVANKRKIRITGNPELAEASIGGRQYLDNGLASLLSIPADKETITEELGFRDLEGKIGRKASRLIKNVNEGKTKWIVYHRRRHGVDTLAHEVGHATTPKKFLKAAKGNSEKALEDHILQKYSDAKDQRYQYDSVKNSLKQGRKLLKEEKRASNEAIKLLKDSGTLSKEEMDRAKKRLHLGYKTHQFHSIGDVLRSLHQKIQIPSRRIPGNFYKSTITPKLQATIYAQEMKKALENGL